MNKTKETLAKEIEEKAKLIEQIKTHINQIKVQKDTIDNLTKNAISPSPLHNDEIEVINLTQQLAQMKLKYDDLFQKHEKLLREKKTQEIEINELKKQNSKLKENNDILHDNLKLSCSEFALLKKKFEEKIEANFDLENAISNLKLSIKNNETKIEEMGEEIKKSKTEKDQLLKKTEELKSKIVASDDYAHIFNVAKESVFGKEDLLVF